MEILSFFLFIFQIYLVGCCENFPNDHLVFSNSSAKCSEAQTPKGERPESQIANFFNRNMLLSFQPFSSNPELSQCRIQMDGVLKEASNLNLWALRMLDASAKLPSGILSGNLNQFGDFDECLDLKGYANNQVIRAKYCLLNIDIQTDRNQTHENIRKVDAFIHSNWVLHSGFKDQGHRIPKFETFSMGVCVPAACSSGEIERAVSEQLNKTLKNNFFIFKVGVDDDVCYVEEEKQSSLTEFIVRFIFLFFLVLIVLGTLVDLNKVAIRHDDIQCIHGARFLNAMALLLSHKQIAMLFNPLMNRTDMSESFSKSWTMIGRSAILYTDSFILFSGLLVSYSMIKDLDRKKTTNFKEKFINRIVRLTPNLFCVIFFCTYIMDALGSGPQWGLVVSKYTNLCKKYMWRNFLFIHNYFGFENMCLTHTHQLGIDMQLFLMSPVFTYMIWKMPKLGSLILVAVSTISTWLRYDVTHKANLSTLLYYGISVERLWKTANMSYILPAHRLTVYLTGVLLGYYLRRGGRNINFSYLQAIVGWVLAIGAGLLAVFGHYHAAFKEYKYNVNDAAIFNAFAPVLWAGFISWGILACLNGYGGILNDFLTWKYFPVFTKISYAIYLTQFPVFFYYVGTERVSQYYKGFQSLFDVTELGVIFIASIILTLTFDIPFQELKNVLKSFANANERKNNDKNNDAVAEGSRTKVGRRNCSLLEHKYNINI